MEYLTEKYKGYDIIVSYDKTAEKPKKTIEKNDKNLKIYEENIGLKQIKEDARGLYRKTKGKKGKYWMACSPIWLNEKSTIGTEYEIAYWVNYGDDNTFGWFSVEQIKKWLTNQNVNLCDLGGTKER